MDSRRFVSWRMVVAASAALALSACASLRDFTGLTVKPARPTAAAAPSTHAAAVAPTPPRAFATMAPIPNPPGRARRNPSTVPMRVAPASADRSPPEVVAGVAARLSPAPPAVTGRAAIAAANVAARETSRSEGFVGGVQVFSYDPGQVYEVWTAPLRVTTLTLAPGEVIVSKAAGDTVRWQIGETTSGQGQAQRAHVMIKPLERGLETNLVLATSQRVYLIQLRSGGPEAFNAAVSWDVAAVASQSPGAIGDPAAAEPPGLVAPVGPLDARYRILPRGSRPAWTPTAVMTDGVRTFLTFPPALGASEAPALFVIGPGGDAQLVNYRQQDGVWVVDRVVDQAELRVGDKPRQTVRITREGGRS
ncbi:TrbG/VirB9 family P-type conjugative transfer protein [Phenylobacterium sp. RIFCSPHIGHO2_01_FULL_69_31]|uniref:TrbG/VirB9 family P-type conjugative transfer protein n=1 Tax=Phenylobacterium sp. RIFCSPHIGHO2_01_FULL_69_31 TaxID=1801944 RepID=UPI0025D56F95|nr:TrbG/VirB9 family P-type conjugative transfer protein [Phenylobacterium sp. RIFCSPHIGHO2_01_FULL_69_31]